MAAIPPPVLGGAGYALFGTVAVVGVQTLRRVDFHDERNVIILAVSLASPSRRRSTRRSLRSSPRAYERSSTAASPWAASPRSC